jgi:hypothetical protein
VSLYYLGANFYIWWTSAKKLGHCVIIIKCPAKNSIALLELFPVLKLL